MSNCSNVLLVTFDCARADATYSLNPPALARIRERGVTFRHAISSAPLTPVSHATVFTGVQPYHHGLRHLFRERLSEKVTTIAERFLANGYETSAVVSCPGMNRWYGFSRGFLHYDDEVPKLPSGESALELVDVKLRGLAMKRADEVAARGISWLTRRRIDAPWFLFLHFFDAHWPYDPPESAPQAKNPYEREIAFADAALSRVLDVVEDLGMSENTIVALFGDHGEDLEGWYPNDKGGVGSKHPEEEGHGCLLYEQTQHVPLVISAPGIPKADILPTVGLVDLMPTLLDLADIPIQTKLDGKSLARLMREPASRWNEIYYAETFFPEELIQVKPQFAGLKPLQALWFGDKYKVVRHFGSKTEQWLYKLNQDPMELNPRSLDEMNITQKLHWPE